MSYNEDYGHAARVEKLPNAVMVRGAKARWIVRVTWKKQGHVGQYGESLYFLTKPAAVEHAKHMNARWAAKAA